MSRCNKECLLYFLTQIFIILLSWIGLCRSADHDCGPGGLWEILTAISHAGRDAVSQWESLLEQVSESYSHLFLDSLRNVCLNIQC